MTATQIGQALKNGKIIQVYDRSDAPKDMWKTAYRLDDIKRGIVTVVDYVSHNNGVNWVVLRSDHIYRLQLDSCIQNIIQAHYEGCEVVIK